VTAVYRLKTGQDLILLARRPPKRSVKSSEKVATSGSANHHSPSSNSAFPFSKLPSMCGLSSRLFRENPRAMRGFSDCASCEYGHNCRAA
jgi:hypothetical protein